MNPALWRSGGFHLARFVFILMGILALAAQAAETRHESAGARTLASSVGIVGFD